MSLSKSAAEAGLELRSRLWVQGTSLSTCSFAFTIHGHASYIEFLCPEIPRALGLSRMDPAKGLQKSSSVYAGGAGWCNWAVRQVGAVPSLFPIRQEGLSSPWLVLEVVWHWYLISLPLSVQTWVLQLIGFLQWEVCAKHKRELACVGEISEMMFIWVLSGSKVKRGKVSQEESTGVRSVCVCVCDYAQVNFVISYMKFCV